MSPRSAKAMGNGSTIAALAGRADLMDLLGTEVTLDGTYYANPYAIAAVRRTIELLEDGGITHLNQLGERLREGLSRAITDTGVTANVTGIGSAWIVNWQPEPPVTFRQAVDADFAPTDSRRSGCVGTCTRSGPAADAWFLCGTSGWSTGTPTR